jgi:hypothetical protein
MVLLLDGGVSGEAAASTGSGGGVFRAREGGGCAVSAGDAAASGGSGGGPFLARDEGGGGREAIGDEGLGLGKFDAEGGWLFMPAVGAGGVVDERGGGGRDAMGAEATGEDDGREVADQAGGREDADAPGDAFGGRDCKRDASHAGGGGARDGERAVTAGMFEPDGGRDAVGEGGGGCGRREGVGGRDATGVLVAEGAGGCTTGVVVAEAGGCTIGVAVADGVGECDVIGAPGAGAGGRDTTAGAIGVAPCSSLVRSAAVRASMTARRSLPACSASSAARRNQRKPSTLSPVAQSALAVSSATETLSGSSASGAGTAELGATSASITDLALRESRLYQRICDRIRVAACVGTGRRFYEPVRGKVALASPSSLAGRTTRSSSQPHPTQKLVVD